jgi:GTP 3',8-cyclase
MLVDSWGRTIQYLRVSVTDRCNLRCEYCMSPEGVSLLPHTAILSYEEIAEVVREAAALGILKVRLTGGEPLVRRNLDRLVAMIDTIPGIEDLTLTTNGILLAPQAQRLATAGLRRVNISLDTLDPERYKKVTRGGDVRKVLAGIEAARKAGLSPIKLNCVISQTTPAEDVDDLRKFADREMLELRLIPQMNLRHGVFGIVHHGGGGGGDCDSCNRLRLTCDGWILPCLFNDSGYSVRELGASEAIRCAAAEKPKSGSLRTTRTMQSIGG